MSEKTRKLFHVLPLGLDKILGYMAKCTATQLSNP